MWTQECAHVHPDETERCGERDSYSEMRRHSHSEERISIYCCTCKREPTPGVNAHARLPASCTKPPKNMLCGSALNYNAG